MSPTHFELLPRAFYAPAADVVAEALLGHWLIRQTPAGPRGGMIVETEAYLRDDSASHAYRGETARNRTMFGPPGHAYVYFIYGVHFCINAVCQARGVGEAVLIRAITPEFGVEEMRDARSAASPAQLTNGPGKLCAALQIDRAHDGADFCDGKSPVIIARNPQAPRARREFGPLARTKRIGITRSADLPLRFCLTGSLYLSQRPPRTR